MNKISITLDAKKLRNLVSKRSYQNREGATVEVQEVKFDLVELAQDKKKVVYDADKYNLEKTHFAVAQQTKEERESKADPVFVGEGITLNWKNDTSTESTVDNHISKEEESSDDLPF